MSCLIFQQGIGTSLGILANILVSMNDEDFSAFRTRPDIDLVGSTVTFYLELSNRTNYFACFPYSLCWVIRIIVFSQQPRQQRWP